MSFKLNDGGEELINGLGSETVQWGADVSTSDSGRRTCSRWGSKKKSKKDEGVIAYPGQLYCTDSGKLFHAGKILIILLGVSDGSKTFLGKSIERYCKWLGVRSKSFLLRVIL